MSKFLVNGQPYETAKAVQEALAKSGINVKVKDILAGKVAEVEIVADAANAPRDDRPTTDTGIAPDAPTGSTDKVLTPKGGVSQPNAASTATGEDDVEYPEVGGFKDEKAIKKFIKKLSDKQLYDWCELEGVTWNKNDHDAINRMRAAMAIKAKHFPDTAPKASGKSKSKYADYTTEQLVALALEHNITVKDDKGNDRILRMYTIMALREAGIIA